MAQRSLPRFSLSQLLHQHPEAFAAGMCGIFIFLGWLTLQFKWVGIGILLLAAAYVIGGYSSARDGLTTLVKDKEFDVDLLMIVAALGAGFLGLWQKQYHLIVDGAILIFIFAISGALEGYAMQRTERSIRSLMSLTPDTARVIQDGQELSMPIAQLKVGEKVLVKPGELIPTDGIITTGYSSVNQASITGESLPVEKSVGDEVFAGTINGNGVLTLRVHQPPESSLIQRVIRLVQQAQTEAPPSQQFIQRFERGYAKVIVFAGVLLTILPPFLWHWDWKTTIYRALIFLVVASPCALMASIMPTLLSGIANGARQGILFKNGAQLENMGRVKAIAFDKTGTLTTGEAQVVQTIPVMGESKYHLLQLAAALEVFSEHPVGQAIVQAAQAQQIEFPRATNVQAYPGVGITGEVNGRQVAVGKADFLHPDDNQLTITTYSPPGVGQEQGQPPYNPTYPNSPTPPASLIATAQQLEAEGKTVVVVQVAGQVLGLIAIADTVRPVAADTIKRLKQLGVEQVIMLTGDNESTAKTVAQQLGVDQVYAELLPEDKVTLIQRLQQQYQTVAMVGDGINDAPALASATVGIAMGSAGSDIALETADIVLMADRLEKLEQAIRIGRRSQAMIKQNIVFALSFIVILLIANFAGEINLPIGVIGHEGSTVLVTLNGLRLLRG